MDFIYKQALLESFISWIYESRAFKQKLLGYILQGNIHEYEVPSDSNKQTGQIFRFSSLT